MDVITIDFETYYDKDYSLSKMTTEAYIRGTQFEVIGLAVKVNDTPTRWYSGDDVAGFLSEYDFSDAAVVAHNTAFDGAILSWHYNINPRLWVDTLSMARYAHGTTIGVSLAALAKHYGLGAKGDEVLRTLGMRRADFTKQELGAFASYCIQDVELTYKLFHKLRRGFPPFEVQVIDQILRMYTQPVLGIDREVLREHLDDISTRRDDMFARLGGVEKARAIFMSNQKFAALLTRLGVEPPTKISARTGKEAFAFAKTDKAMTDLANHADPRVQMAASIRLDVKSTIEETRTANLIEVSERGALPVMLNWYGARSGRLSAGDKLNLQNLPTRGGNNAIRRSIKPPAGYVLVAGDSSQIEARLNAYVSGQHDLVEAFRQGRDVYCEFASDVYGCEITKDDTVERFTGKTGILSLGYGSGHKTFREMLRVMGGVAVDEDEAQRIVQVYRAKYTHITSMWRRLDNALRRVLAGDSGVIVQDVLTYDEFGIRLPNGMYMQYPLLNEDITGQMTFARDQREYRRYVSATVSRFDGSNVEPPPLTNVWGGFVLENLCQALAALIIREQMLEVGKRYRVVFQVHDEIICIAPENYADDAVEYMTKIMSTPPTWAADLPVACEVGTGYNYGEAK